MVRYRSKTPPKRTPTFAKRPKSKPAKRPTRVVKTLKRATPKSKPFSLVQKAWATTEAPSTAGKFNPPGWTSQQDYGTQQVKSTPVTTGFGGEKKVWHKSQSGKLGKAIAASKKQNPQAWKKATGQQSHTDKLHDFTFGGGTATWKNPQGQSITGTFNQWEAGIEDRWNAKAQSSTPGPYQPPKVTQVAQQHTGSIAQRASSDTWYATGPDGKTHKGKGKLSMQARQYYAEQGVKVSSRPPGQFQQQRLSDTTGVTTYTQFGDISTTPRDLTGQPQTKLRIEQQKLSDKYGVTTYNKDGSVSTVPKGATPPQSGVVPAPEQARGSWWWDSPFTVSADGTVDKLKAAQQGLTDKYGVTTFNKDGSVSTKKEEKKWGWW